MKLVTSQEVTAVSAGGFGVIAVLALSAASPSGSS